MQESVSSSFLDPFRSRKKACHLTLPLSRSPASLPRRPTRRAAATAAAAVAAHLLKEAAWKRWGRRRPLLVAEQKSAITEKLFLALPSLGSHDIHHNDTSKREATAVGRIEERISVPLAYAGTTRTGGSQLTM